MSSITTMNVKRQPLIDKVLPDFRDKAVMEPIQKNGSHPEFLVTQAKDWQLVVVPPTPHQGSGLRGFIGKGSSDHKSTTFAQNCALAYPSLP